MGLWHTLNGGDEWWKVLTLTGDFALNELRKQRVIYLGSEIDEALANEICGQLILFDSQSTDQDIWIYINSPGGSVLGGMAIYDAMQFVESDVATLCLGAATSMAQIILTGGAAGKRHALPSARIMMHQPLGQLSGTAADVQIQAELLLSLKSTMAKLNAHHTGRDLEQIRRDSERDRWFSADEAVDYGIIDQVMTSR